MIFQSIEFLIFFIVVLIGIRILWDKKYQHFFLLCASYYFYYLTNNICIFLLALITLILFYCGSAIHNANTLKYKRLYLVISIISALGILGFFKYYNFGIENLNNIAAVFHLSISLKPLDIILPIGISFYTFGGLSYVFDIYLGKIEPVNKLYKFALLIAYFPHLLAGPIVRASQFFPQLKNKLEITPENLRVGITLILWGLVKKIIIADNIAPYVNFIFSYPIGQSSFIIIFATILFGIQIFCDFSGYCDIALGVAQIIGIKLPINFLRPYLTKNPTEFWRSWNITLSSFIRDYVYIPLGGNRKGKIRSYINLLIAMLLCGIWHGASWNFVIWGAYHGMLLSCHKIITKEYHIGEKCNFLSQTVSGNVVKILVTQYFIFLGWLIFRVRDLPNLTYCLKQFIWIDWIFTSTQKVVLLGLCVFIIIFFILLQKKEISSWIVNAIMRDWIAYFAHLPLKYWLCYLICVLLILLFFAPTSNPEFIYFQF